MSAQRHAKGTPLHIIMKDGTIREGKYKDQKSRHLMLEDGERIPKAQIRSVDVNKRPGALFISEPATP